MEAQRCGGAVRARAEGEGRMRTGPREVGWRLGAAALALWLGAGCAWLPDDLFRDPAEDPAPAPALPPPLEDCDVLTILINASQRGDPKITERARAAISSEFRRFGATITDSPEEAYWSLMLLATPNSRRDGFILNALLSARSGLEGAGPGMSVFRREAGQGQAEAEGPAVDAGGRAAEPAPPGAPEGAVATLYTGLAFGPHAQLQRRARELTRQAYAAVYPAARRMCDYDASERQRERELREQLPPAPELL